jgi:non-ribosomal peptide synthetase component F
VGAMDEAGRLLPAGATGEIVIRGENVMRGYEGNPEANRRAFTDSWFRTGDQGHLDPQGYVFLTGRIKEIINRGGEKISPREIDEVLLDHPAVAQAVAFGIPDAELGEDVGAAVVLREKAAATEREIREFAATRLAHFKVPAQVVFLREIPKGPTGKLQRVGLARVLGIEGRKRGPAPRRAFRAPVAPVEQALAKIWEEILGVGPVGLDDHFQQLGGDSLGCTRVAGRIRQALGAELTVAQLFAAPTLREQAELVERAAKLPPAPVDDLARLLDEVEGERPQPPLNR